MKTFIIISSTQLLLLLFYIKIFLTKSLKDKQESIYTCDIYTCDIFKYIKIVQCE